MKKQLLAIAALLSVCCLGPHAATAQLPGGIKVLKLPKREKAQPAPTPTESAPTAPPGETQPSAQPSAPAQPQAAGGPAVLKHSVAVHARTVTSYKGVYGTHSWTPAVMFNHEGAAPNGSHFYAVVSLPDGSPWIELDCEWKGNATNLYQCGGPNVPEEKGVTATGVFPFTIKMRNELRGIDQTLFAGKVRIDKAPDDSGTPAERARKSSFFPVHDWALPVGYVYYSPQENFLYTAFWVRGASGRITPHVFYRGKNVGPAQEPSCRDALEVGDAYIRSVNPAPVWRFVQCQLYVPFSDRGGEYRTPPHYLTANPGEYEIKVLRNDELSRSIKFAVGPDGQLAGGAPVLYTLRWADGDRQPGVVVPVAILDGQDGPRDKNAWKTEAFYGNLLKGFAPAP
ncbi:MAG TPA: hypothetical protein VN282_13000 [Pyrinomonadaceae bacterium]|nr:hypothetical protein [Pyrinomonadaceae bacterium]